MKLIKKILIYSLAHLAIFGALNAEAQLPELLIKRPVKDRDVERAFPTVWSGTLPRPILFVHGIASDGYSTWGLYKPTCKEINYLEWSYSHYDEEYWESYGDGMGGSRAWRTKEGVKYSATCGGSATITGTIGVFDESNVKFSGARHFTDKKVDEIYIAEQGVGIDPGLAISSDIIWNGMSKLGTADEPKASKLGLTTGYKANSTPAYLAQRYGLDTGYNPRDPESRINNNGLEFYNISKIDVTTTSPLTTDKTSYIHPQDQAKDLLEKFVSVLNEYYPDWRKNPDAMIDLVVHSQGGLVTRSMLQQAPRTNDLSHPLNHINHIITIDTPHLGTALPHMNRGVTSVMRMADYVLNDIENLDTVTVLGVASMDFLPAELLKPVHVLHENAQHLRYACNLHNTAWEPSVSDVTDPKKMESDERVALCVGNQNIPTSYAWGRGYYDVEFLKPYIAGCKSKLKPMVDAWYSGKDTDCSTYMTELKKAGYPKAPNGRMIPMTAMYGRLNPEGFMQLLELAKGKALDGCTKIKTGLTFNDCKKKVRRLINGVIDITREGLANEWVAHSDFAVDVSSQVGLGLFDESKHPFRKVEITPINPDVGVIHMDMSKLEEDTGMKLPGAAWHGEEIFKALQNKPKAKVNMTGPYLLLLQN